MFWILLVCIGCTYFGWKEDVNSIIIAITFLNTIFIIINIWCFKNLVNSIPAEKEIELFEKENTKINNFLKHLISENNNNSKNIFDTNIEMNLNFHEIKNNDLIIKQLDTLITNRQKIIELNRSILYRKVYRKYLLFF